jgi:hypothetical protein
VREIKQALGFIKEAIEIGNQLVELSGEIGRNTVLGPERSSSGKSVIHNRERKQKQGYVIKTKESTILQKFLSAKNANLSLSLQIEPQLGEPIEISANVRLTRGGRRNDK